MPEVCDAWQLVDVIGTHEFGDVHVGWRLVPTMGGGSIWMWLAAHVCGDDR